MVAYPLVVLRKSATEMVAFDARCPHLGCAVTGAQSLFVCPCHGSIYSHDGQVIHGPATEALATKPVPSATGPRRTARRPA